jgi:superfamily II DNA or RNA helicase
MTSPLSVGMFVRLKTDPARAGILKAGERIHASRRLVPVQFSNSPDQWLPESALEAVPDSAPPLSQRIADGSFVDSDWLRRTLTRVRVTGRLSEIIYSMEATDTDFYAYQYKPVLKLLNSPTDGLLIADEVGLGKTIEAGLIWTELRARFDSNRLLVLCPKTLCEKWTRELHNRFGVDAKIVNAQGLLEILTNSRQTNRGFAAVASMQSLRPPKGWDETPDDGSALDNSPRAKLARFLEESAAEQPSLDLLVIDEAHHMRNPETLLHSVARLTNGVSSYRVFLSATPIHLRNRDLHSLLKLIDPETFEHEGTLEALIEVNAPVIAARDLLLKPKVMLKVIREHLDEAASYPILAGSKSLGLIRDQLSRDLPLNPQARADLAMRLEQVNQLANYITRTRRRDVQEFKVVRDPKAPHLDLAPIEREFYQAVTNEVRKYAFERDSGEGFLLATPQRLLTSSPAAASAYWEGLLAVKTDQAVEDTDDDLDDDEPDQRPLVSRLSALSKRMALSGELAAIDSKYTLLRKELRGLWKQEAESKVIVFSSFKATLHYLRDRLASDGVRTELLHGSIKEPRDAVLERFKNTEGPSVLLSSEVGSEGVDLQFCWTVINYDLPWNPMRLEQRIGRVDRLGQKKEKIVVINLFYSDTIDERIYRRLYERLGLGQRALGEFESVLGMPIREMTRKLLDPRLSNEEMEDVIDQTAQAVENRKRVEDQLENEAGSLVRHGDHILQAISESRDLNRWLSNEDILQYVSDRLHRSFAGCVIETSPAGSDTYRISLSVQALEQFVQFIGRRNLRGSTRLVNASDRQRYRFTRSVVSSSSSDVECISQVHPLVRFAAELDALEDGIANPEVAAASVTVQEVKAKISVGTYILAVQRWSARADGAANNSSSRLAYAGVNCDGGEPLAPEVAEALTQAASEYGKPIPNLLGDKRILIAASRFETQVISELAIRFDDFCEQARAQVEDRSAIRRQALIRHRDEKLAKLKDEISKREERAREHRRKGEETKSRQASSLVEATKGKAAKLQAVTEEGLQRIEAERNILPEMGDIAAIFVEVRPSKSRKYE